jgi:hypothetical protein
LKPITPVGSRTIAALLTHRSEINPQVVALVHHSTEHLLNIHRVARLRPNARWMDTPRKTWLDPAIGPKEILEIYNRNY